MDRFCPKPRAMHLCFACCTLLVVANGVGAQQRDEALVHEFLTDAPAKWTEYRVTALLQQMDGTYIVRSNGKASTNRRLQYKANARCWMHVMQPLEQDAEFPVGHAYVVNEIYAFKLRRSNATAAWAVVDVIDRTNADELPREFVVNKTQSTSLLLSPCDSTFENWSELVGKPTFKVVGAKKVTHGQQELVEISFENSTTPESTHPLFPASKYVSGTFWFDRERAWRPVRRSFKTENGITGEGWIEYEESSADLSGMRHSSGAGDYPLKDGKKMKMESETSATIARPSNSPSDDEFTLTAFGLPEPPWVKQKAKGWRPPLYVWALAGGLACLVAAYALRRRARPRSEG